MINPETRAYIHKMVADEVVPGVSYAILHQGNIEQEVLGAAELVPHYENLKPNMLYDVASLTKVIGTTTVILKLMEDKKIDIDLPVKNYLPQFQDSRVTLRHLLTHTSNLQGYIKNRNQLSADALIKALFSTLKVGDGFEHRVVYADVGLIFTGLVIENFYGRPVQDVIQTEVLDPLGMKDSTFTPQKEDCVPTEIEEQRGGLIRGEVHDPKGYILGRRCGSAGLFTSLRDMIRFAQWIMSSAADHPVLQPKTIDSLYADWTPNHRLGRSLGWDLRFTPQGRPLIFHTGYTGTLILVDKEKQDALIFLSNRVHPSSDNHEFIRRRDVLVGKYLREKEKYN